MFRQTGTTSSAQYFINVVTRIIQLDNQVLHRFLNAKKSGYERILSIILYLFSVPKSIHLEIEDKRVRKLGKCIPSLCFEKDAKV